MDKEKTNINEIVDEIVKSEAADDLEKGIITPELDEIIREKVGLNTKDVNIKDLGNISKYGVIGDIFDEILAEKLKDIYSKTDGLTDSIIAKHKIVSDIEDNFKQKYKALEKATNLNPLTIELIAKSDEIKEIVKEVLDEHLHEKTANLMEIVNELNLKDEPPEPPLAPAASDLENTKKVYNDLLLNGKKQPFQVVLIPIDKDGKLLDNYAPIRSNLVLNSTVTVKEMILAIKESQKK